MSQKLKRSISNIVLEKRNFKFPNGDDYEGEFAVNMKTKKIVRQGYGVYTTIDCQQYIGQWSNDVLTSPAKIQYPNAQHYEGDVSETLAYQKGVFNFADGSKIVGDFRNDFDKNDAGGVGFWDCNGMEWDLLVDAESERIMLKKTAHRV